MCVRACELVVVVVHGVCWGRGGTRQCCTNLKATCCNLAKLLCNAMVELECEQGEQARGFECSHDL